MSELFQTNASIEKVPKLVTSDSLYLLSREQNEKSENKPEVITFGGSNTLERYKTKRTSREIKNDNFDIDELIPDLDNQTIAIEDNNQLNDPSKTKLLTSNPEKYTETDKNSNKSIIHERTFKKLIRKHDISRFFSKKLRVLYDFKIVFILDDSGSMNEQLEDSPLNRGKFKATRWDELQEFMKISIEIAAVLNEDGCDVYFLNRPMVKNVHKFEELKPRFKSKPSGLTPITAILSKVLKNNMPSHLNDKKLLTIIVTDGEPTNTEGKVDIKGFKECLISRPTNVYTTILACTDEANSMEYLNNWDKYIQRLDVVDDFRSERQEILRSQGSYFHFTYGDYVVKSLIGSIDPSIDNLDENKFKCCRIL